MMTKKANLAILVLVGLSAIVCSTLAETKVGGTLSGSVLWEAARGPYMVTSSILVQSSAILEIEPGTVVKMGAGLDFKVSGTLLSKGTQDQPVQFIADGIADSKPFWGSILLQNADANSAISYTKIENAGRLGKAAIVISGNLPAMAGIQIENSKYNGIEYEFSSSSGEVNLQNPGVPYVYPNGAIVNSNTSLTIGKGVRIEIGPAKDFYVKGGMIASGAPSGKIVFANCSGQGPWGGLIIEKEATKKSQLAFCEFARGGASPSAQNSSICIIDASPLIEYCSFREPAGYGISINGLSSPDLGGALSQGANKFSAFSGSNYSILNKSKNDISAKNNCWGVGLELVKSLIYDKNNNSSRGAVDYSPISETCSGLSISSPKLISPENGKLKLVAPILLSWSSVKYAEKYQLIIADNSEFADSTGYFHTDTSFTFSQAESGKKYFWKVIALSGNYKSIPSELFTFITKSNLPPSEPKQIYPLSGDENVDCGFEFLWAEVEDADCYRLDVANDSLFQTILFKADSITKTSYSYKTLNHETGLYWRIIAINQIGQSAGQVAYFKTKPCQIAPPPESWNYESQTGSNMMILVRQDVEFARAFYTLTTGDAIGVFFTSGGNMRCAGYAYWEGDKNIVIMAWGDNSQTQEIKEGLSSSEKFSFKIWDSNLKKEMIVSTRFSAGRANYKSDTIAILKQFTAPDTFKLTIKPGGVNFMASPYTYSEIKIDKPGSVLLSSQSINYDGQTSENTISEISGFDAYALAPVTFSFIGTNDESGARTFNLESGRTNIMPVWSTHELIIAGLFKSNASKILLIKDDCDNIYYPGQKIDQIRNLLPGKYYKVFVKETLTIEFPADYSNGNSVTIVYPSNQANGNSAILDIETQGISDSDTITAFDSRGNILGTSTPMGGKAMMIIKGDNIFTNGLAEVAMEGELISFKSKKYSTLKITNLINLVGENNINGLAYKKDGIFSMKLSNDIVSMVMSDDAGEAVKLSDDLLSISIGGGQMIHRVKIYNYSGEEIGLFQTDISVERMDIPFEYGQGLYFVLVDTQFGLKAFKVNKIN